MSKQLTPLIIIASFVATACASSRQQVADETAAAPIVPVDATVRIVNGDTTWVSRGSVYEIVARSRSDLGKIAPLVSQEADMFRRIFPNDTLPPLVITISRDAMGAPSLPTDIPGMVVDLTLPDVAANSGARANASRQQSGGRIRERSVILPVVRAWLSAHATHLTHTRADLTVANGSGEDPRVPPWAEEAIPMLAANSDLDRSAVALAAHMENIFPLSQFFSMARPEFVAPSAEERKPPRGGGEGGEGGRSGGGRGGMGGSGRSGGRGGAGGRGAGGGEGAPQSKAPALQGAVLFSAQSYAVARYLVAREGYDFIGSFLDNQILAKPVDDFLAERKTFSMTEMEADWRSWLGDYADSAHH